MKKEFEIINNICLYYNVDNQTILSKNCTRKIVRIREQIAFILYNFLDFEEIEISKLLNVHQHSIYVYIKRVQEDFDIDKNLRKLLVSFL